MYLGSSYKSLLNVQKKVACWIVERMKKTGGYVMPRLVKEDRPIFFAIDNIDFLENTASILMDWEPKNKTAEIQR